MRLGLRRRRRQVQLRVTLQIISSSLCLSFTLNLITITNMITGSLSMIKSLHVLYVPLALSLNVT